MTRPILQIFTPIRMEERAVRRAIEAARRDSKSFQDLEQRFEVRVTLIGMMGALLPVRLDPEDRCVILAGLAGGLDPSLAVGDCVVEAGLHNDEARMTNDETGSIRVADELENVRRGRIACVDVPVTTTSEKSSLYHSTGALAVEMEGTAVRRLTESAGVPMIHLRAISDSAADSLDPAVLCLVDAKGDPRWGAVAFYLLRHPNRVRSLMKLGGQSKMAVNRLGQTLVQLLTSRHW